MTTIADHPAARTSEATPAAAAAEETLTFLLRFALLAPSGHNTQPWRFTVAGDTACLYADREQALPVVDPHDRALTISCGAALLNLRVALRRHGFRDDLYDLRPDGDAVDLLARVRLAAGEPPSPHEEALFAAIAERRTTRAPYEERQLPPETEHVLQRAAAAEGAWLHAVGEERQTVAALVAAGDRLQLADDEFRRELAAWIRPNRSRAARGMRGYGFGFGDALSLAGPFVIRSFDLGERRAAKDEELALAAPLLAVLGTDEDTPRAWLAAGQAVERVLLHACALGLTSSFLNQPVEVEALRPRLAAAIGRSGGHPQLVLRFGYGPRARPMPREPLDDVLTRPLRAGRP
jgi:nitroreductase